MFKALEGYTPQKVEDKGFEVIKARSLACQINYARIEDSTHPEHLGEKNFGYELQITEPQEFSGRRLWKRYFLSDEASLKKLADQLFTLDLEFKSEEELQACCEKLVDMKIEVRAWGWTPTDATEPRQMHSIKGVAKETAETEPVGNVEAPF